MKKIDLIRMGLNNLLRRKLRTFLTALGIVIGTISIVVMFSIGMGMQDSITKEMAKFGNLNIIEVSVPGSGSNSYIPSNTSSTTKDKEKVNIKDEDITTFKQIEGVEAVSPLLTYQVTLSNKQYINSCDIKGVNLDFFEYYGLSIDKGRTITKDDKYAIVFGSKIPYCFYDLNNYSVAPQIGENGEIIPPPVDLFKDKITLNFNSTQISTDSNEKMGKPVTLTPVGSLKKPSHQYSIIMDIETLTKLRDTFDKMTKYKAYNGRKPRNLGYEDVLVYVPNKADVKDVQAKIQRLGYRALSDIDSLEQVNSITNIIKMVFGGIGGIALLVAAIGITNTMVMAIHERRSEIGVMKVIGSSIRDIKRLFLFESATLGLFGGLIGIIISVIISFILNNLLPEIVMGIFDIGMGDSNLKLSIIPSWLIISALTFTAFIGLVSGYLPARKAMKLSALEAIQTE